MCKVCTKCKKNKDETCFGKRSKAADGLQPWCKECISKRDKERAIKRNKKRKEAPGRVAIRFFPYQSFRAPRRVEQRRWPRAINAGQAVRKVNKIQPPRQVSVERTGLSGKK